MENSKVYYDKNKKVEIWSEYVNGSKDYWMKINGVSYPITKRQYVNRLKKTN